jgi:hypothetical protein
MFVPSFSSGCTLSTTLLMMVLLTEVLPSGVIDVSSDLDGRNDDSGDRKDGLEVGLSLNGDVMEDSLDFDVG